MKTLSIKYLAFPILAAAIVSRPYLLSAQQPADPIPRQISAAGEASALVQPDTVRITFAFGQRGASTAETSEAIEKRVQAVIAEAQKLESASLNVVYRGSELRPAQETVALAMNAPVRITRYLALETSNLSKTPLIVDAGLRNGATHLQNVEFLIRDGTAVRSQLFAQASKKARANAQAIADSLGVKLGRLLEAASNEEPVAVSDQSTFQPQNPGANEAPPAYSDREIQVLVSTRYELLQD